VPEFRAPSAAPVVAHHIGEVGFVAFVKACHRLDVLDRGELLRLLGLHGAVLRATHRPLDEGEGIPPEALQALAQVLGR
jgi:hypothetical protein